MKSADFLKICVALNRAKGMGPVVQRAWVEADGDVSMLPLGLQEALQDKNILKEAERELQKANEADARIITLWDEEYPELLKAIFQPPVALYVQGQLPSQDKTCVAVVGSRLSSLYGQKMAKSISQGLAKAGVPVVSGLARGIDTAAHEGALSVEGMTVAVFGTGLAQVYPAENRSLARQIVEKGGALISEYPMDMKGLPYNFPLRNRIISGVSRGVLIVEARRKSGALITADLALEEGREVFAIPGNVDSPRSSGTNDLLMQGAKMILSATDILEELGLVTLTARKEEESSGPRVLLSETENRILSLLEEETLHVDELIEKSNITPSEAASVLSLLEIKGCVKQLPGKNFIKS